MLGLLCILPLLVGWPGCFCLSRELAQRRHIHLDWRLNWMFACLAFGSILTLIVEISSLAHSLNRPTLVVFWCAADVMLLLYALRLRNSRQAQETSHPETVQPSYSFSDWPIDAKLLMGITALTVVFLFF